MLLAMLSVMFFYAFQPFVNENTYSSNSAILHSYYYLHETKYGSVIAMHCIITVVHVCGPPC
jgi:hypothetical protein